MPSGTVNDLNLLVDTFTRQVPRLTHAIVVSPDGMLVAASAHLRRDRADQLAAVTAGLVSVTAAAARALDGDEVTQTVIEMGRGYLVAMTASDGSIVVALAGRDADLGLLGYEMVRLVGRVGTVRAPAEHTGGR